MRRRHLLDVGADVGAERVDDLGDLLPFLLLVERRQNLVDVAGRRTASVRSVDGGWLGNQTHRGSNKVA